MTNCFAWGVLNLICGTSGEISPLIFPFSH